MKTYHYRGYKILIDEKIPGVHANLYAGYVQEKSQLKAVVKGTSPSQALSEAKKWIRLHSDKSDIRMRFLK